MVSLLLGLGAALAWAVHDFLARKLSAGLSVLPMMVVVLGAGAVVLVPGLALPGQAAHPLAQGWSLAAGLAYAAGISGLYKAFQLAPARLVAPIAGAFPVPALALAALGGQTMSGLDWAAAALVLAGLLLVARGAQGDEGAARPGDRPGPALAWAVQATLGFALAFHLGQEAARLGGLVGTSLAARCTALAVLGTLALIARAPRPPRAALVVLAGMGVLDALALGLVTLAAHQARPEFATVSASLFGVFTILLAWRLLGERVAPAQMPGLAAAFAGLALLALGA